MPEVRVDADSPEQANRVAAWMKGARRRDHHQRQEHVGDGEAVERADGVCSITEQRRSRIRETA
jgi:hypothetical protein